MVYRTQEERNNEIKKGVAEYIQREFETDARDNRYFSQVISVLTDAGVYYLQRLKVGEEEQQASELAEDYIKRFGARVYENIVSLTDNETVKEPNNVTAVQQDLVRQIQLLFRGEKPKMQALFSPRNRVRDNTHAYIHFLDKLNQELPSFIFTDFIISRDTKTFVREVSEYFNQTSYIKNRTEEFFRAMYVYETDPRYGLTEVNHTLNWDELERLIFQYILSHKKMARMVNVPTTSESFYRNIDNWNNRQTHNNRHPMLYERAYLGAIRTKNNIYPEGNHTKAMSNVIQLLLTDKVLTSEGHFIPEKKLQELQYQLVRTGTAELEIRDTLFIIGKRLIIVEESAVIKHDGKDYRELVIKDTLAHSDVNRTDIANYTNKYVGK